MLRMLSRAGGAARATWAARTFSADAAVESTFRKKVNEDPVGVSILIAAGGGVVFSVYAAVEAKFQNDKVADMKKEVDKLEEEVDKLEQFKKDLKTELEQSAKKAIDEGKDAIKTQAKFVRAQQWWPMYASFGALGLSAVAAMVVVSRK